MASFPLYYFDDKDCLIVNRKNGNSEEFIIEAPNGKGVFEIEINGLFDDKYTDASAIYSKGYNEYEIILRISYSSVKMNLMRLMQADEVFIPWSFNLKTDSSQLFVLDTNEMSEEYFGGLMIDLESDIWYKEGVDLIFRSVDPIKDEELQALNIFHGEDDRETAGSEFVSTLYSNFIVNGRVFKFNGTNAYYLPNYQKDGPHPGDPAMVDRFFTAAEQAEIKVVRMWAFYDGYDIPGSYSHIDPRENVIQTAPGVYSEEALTDLDEVIYKGKQKGLYFILPFVNYWFELGGVAQYNYWSGMSLEDSMAGGARMGAFIDGVQQQEWFLDYIEMLLNRVNTFTGVAYKDEPAIMSWEIINEGRLGAQSSTADAEALRDWYQSLAQYIKGIDENHMVSTGEEGFEQSEFGMETDMYHPEFYTNTYVLRANEGTSYFLNTEIPEIDFGGSHWYPSAFGIGSSVNPGLLQTQKYFNLDRRNIAAALGKPYFIGEYGLANSNQLEKLAMYTPLYRNIEDDKIAGSAVWQLTADNIKAFEYQGNIIWDVNGSVNPTRNLFLEYKNHSQIMNRTPDETAPVISNPTITVFDFDNNNIFLRVDPASDPEMPYGSFYWAYWSLEDNLNSVEETLANGTLGDFTTEAPTVGFVPLDIGSLPQDTLIYFNVLTSNPNKQYSAYDSGSVTTEFGDQIPPVLPGDASLTLTEERGTLIILSYNQATDDTTPQGSLRYELYSSLVFDPGSTVSQIQQNGDLIGESVGSGSIFAISVPANSDLHCRLIVFDEQNNGSVYDYLLVQTGDVPTAEIDDTNPMSSGLVAYLNFHEGIGTDVQDIAVTGSTVFATAEGNDGEWDFLNGQKTWRKRSNFSEWLLLDNRTELEFPGESVSFAVQAEFNSPSESLFMLLYKGGGGLLDGFNLAFPGWQDGLRVSIGGVTEFIDEYGIDDIRDGNLHLIVVTVDSPTGTAILYVDGDEIYQMDLTGNSKDVSTNFDVTMPIINAETGYHVTYGKVAMWDRVLTPTEISDWANDINFFVITEEPEDNNPPSIPNGTLTEVNTTTGTVTVGFQKAIDDQTDQEDLNYRLYSSDLDNIQTIPDILANGTFQEAGDDVTQLTGIGFDPETTYYFNVIVQDLSGNMSAYNSIGIETAPIEPGVPFKPSIIQTLVGNGMIQSEFSINDNNSPLTDVEYELDGGYPQSFGFTITPFNLGGLTNGIEYTIRIRGVNAEGNGAWSDPITETPSGLDNPIVDTGNSLADDLVLYYDFYEGIGNVNDISQSANEHDGTKSNGFWRLYGSRMVWGKRLDLGGNIETLDHADLDFSGADEFTIGMIVSYDANNGVWNHLINKGSNPGWQVRFPGWQKGDLYFDVGDQSIQFTGVNITGVGTFHSVVFVCNGIDQSVSLYVDGSLHGTVGLGGQGSTGSGGSAIYLPDSTPDTELAAYFDKFAVWRRALGGAEVTSWSNNPNSILTGGSPDAPVIQSANSGDTEIFVNFTVTGGQGVTDIEYRLNSGSWVSGGTTSSPLVITGQPNQATLTQIEIRAINTYGASPASNTTFGRATERLNLPRYFALDTDLHSALVNADLVIGEMSDHDVVHSANRTSDTPDESWERLSGEDAGFAAGFGSMLEDHNGDLRLYYQMRFPDGSDLKTSFAVMRSTDNGATWSKYRQNANTGLINDAQSNLISIPTPSGLSNDEIDSAVFYYDPIAVGGQDYKVAYTWSGSQNVYYATSSDGITFTGGSVLITITAFDEMGDIAIAGLFWNGDHWVITARGRGRGGNLEAWPKPYEDTRWAWVARSSTTFDGSYTIEKFVIDPATLFGYGSEADSESFWDLISDGCGSRHVPDNPAEAEVRPDMYSFPCMFYEGQYIALVPVFFKDDDKVPYTSNDRTSGEIYPVWFHARNVRLQGGNDGWKAPSTDPGVNLTPYQRVNNNSCSVSNGENRVGQTYSIYGFVRKSGNMISATLDVTPDHYDVVNIDFDNVVEISIERMVEDRFAGLSSSGGTAEWRTGRIYIPYGKTELLVNTDADTKVEVLNSITGDPIPGFTEADANEITTNGTSQEATWSSNNISELEGQNVRLKFYYVSGDVYSFRFN